MNLIQDKSVPDSSVLLLCEAHPGLPAQIRVLLRGLPVKKVRDELLGEQKRIFFYKFTLIYLRSNFEYLYGAVVLCDIGRSL